MQCPRCQQDNPSHAKFCLECGTPLNRVEESPQSVASYADLERSLAESLEQQTATAEVLRVISSSPTDLTPVAQAIADSAGQLCGCAFSAVFRSDGELIHRVAARGTSREQEEALRLAWPRPPGRDTPDDPRGRDAPFPRRGIGSQLHGDNPGAGRCANL
jgi:hypothetical protein